MGGDKDLNTDRRMIGISKLARIMGDPTPNKNFDRAIEYFMELSQDATSASVIMIIAGKEDHYVEDDANSNDDKGTMPVMSKVGYYMKICVLQLHRGRKRLLEDGDRVCKPCAGTHHQHPAQQHPSPHHHHQQQHRHKHPEPQMRQRLAVLEARLSQLCPVEPRPPTSSSHSIGFENNHQSLNREM